MMEKVNKKTERQLPLRVVRNTDAIQAPEAQAYVTEKWCLS